MLSSYSKIYVTFVTFTNEVNFVNGVAITEIATNVLVV